MKTMMALSSFFLVVSFANADTAVTAQDPKIKWWPITQENKIYYYLINVPAMAWGIYENAFKAALPVDYYEQKGIRVENPTWRPTAAYAQLAKELNIPESTARKLTAGMKTRTVSKGVSLGSLALTVALGLADYYGYIPKASENQIKNLPENIVNSNSKSTEHSPDAK